MYCVNSLAHWLGDTPFDDKHTPRDHLLTVLITIGEGYHNFHHQFPMDYRNVNKWYQYDPTKWLIYFCCEVLGLGTHLKVFPDNEVWKGQLTMVLKKLRRTQDEVVWPVEGHELPVISWETCLSFIELIICYLFILYDMVHVDRYKTSKNAATGSCCRVHT